MEITRNDSHYPHNYSGWLLTIDDSKDNREVGCNSVLVTQLHSPDKICHMGQKLSFLSH